MFIRTLLIAIASLNAIQTAHATCNEPERFNINTDRQTVLDTQTGLTWQYCPYGRTGVNCEIGTTLPMDKNSALLIATDASTGNFTDWRLPSVKELNSLVNVNCFSPSIDNEAFPETPNRYFWSNDVFTGDFAKSWAVNFESGEDGVAFNGQRFAVRLVRSSAQ